MKRWWAWVKGGDATFGPFSDARSAANAALSAQPKPLADPHVYVGEDAKFHVKVDAEAILESIRDDGDVIYPGALRGWCGEVTDGQVLELQTLLTMMLQWWCTKNGQPVIFDRILPKFVYVAKVVDGRIERFTEHALGDQNG